MTKSGQKYTALRTIFFSNKELGLQRTKMFKIKKWPQKSSLSSYWGVMSIWRFSENSGSKIHSGDKKIGYHIKAQNWTKIIPFSGHEAFFTHKTWFQAQKYQKHLKLLLTDELKNFHMYQSRLSLPSGFSRKSTHRARQRVFGGWMSGWVVIFYPSQFLYSQVC